ncbi:hypothetical protein FAP94_10105 [Morganella morganii]|nr:hypothetical protein [Morganella morganii]
MRSFRKQAGHKFLSPVKGTGYKVNRAVRHAAGSSLIHPLLMLLPIPNIMQADIKMAEDKLGHDLFD